MVETVKVSLLFYFLLGFLPGPSVVKDFEATSIGLLVLTLLYLKYFFIRATHVFEQ